MRLFLIRTPAYFFLVLFLFLASSDHNIVFAKKINNNSLDKDTYFLEVYKKIKSNGKYDSNLNIFALKNHELYPYLNYYNNLKNIDSMSYKDFQKTYDAFGEFYLKDKFKMKYLSFYAKKGKWDIFLNFDSSAGFSRSLKCSFYLARFKLNIKDSKLFIDSAELLKNFFSKEKSCNKLFSYIKQDLDDNYLWKNSVDAFSNMGLSTINRNIKLFDSKNYQNAASLLSKYYRNPKLLFNYKGTIKDKQLQDDVIRLAAIKLAKRRNYKVKGLLEKFKKKRYISDASFFAANQELVYICLIERKLEYKEFFDNFLVKNIDKYPNRFLSNRIRLALSENNWKDVSYFYDYMNDSFKEKFLFWKNFVDNKDSRPDLYKAKLEKISNDRNFYGFVASQFLSKNISLNKMEVVADSAVQKKISSLSSIKRIKRLNRLNLYLESRREWFSLLNFDIDYRQLALFAYKNNWSNFSIEASIKSKSWDLVDFRFPYFNKDLFKLYAKKMNLSEYDLVAIARRESAFNQIASSRYAYGLMQLRPSTAKSIAKKIGVSYRGVHNLSSVNFNLHLGSAYYASLLKRYNNNRILALSAYNAGPKNLDRWLKKSKGKLSVLSFIESIPFLETREYVKAILVYIVIYKAIDNINDHILTKAEIDYNY